MLRVLLVELMLGGRRAGRGRTKLDVSIVVRGKELG